MRPVAAARRRSSRRRASGGRGGWPCGRPCRTRSAGRVAAPAVAMGTSERTRSGNITPHSSTCMPPIDPPTTVSHWSTPRWSASDRLGAHHVADRDHREAGAVRPAVARMRRRRAGGALAAAEDVGAHDEEAVGVEGRPGPDAAASHQPAVGWPGPMGPAAWLSPVRAWQTRTALRAGGVELAPRLVGDGDVVEEAAALERERAVGGQSGTAGARAGRPAATRR